MDRVGGAHRRPVSLRSYFLGTSRSLDSPNQTELVDSQWIVKLALPVGHNAVMAAEEYREVERKYDVEADTAFASFAGVDGIVEPTEPQTFELRATYYDTEDRTLAANRMTLRRRIGGDDAGWHLKMPGDGDERTEYRLPLGDQDENPPAPLVDRVRGLVRTAKLLPVARIDTTRRVHRFSTSSATRINGGNGSDARTGSEIPVVAEVADDRVEAQQLPEGEVVTWREWEVELIHGDETLLEAMNDAVLATGARPAKGPSKLARVLGDTVPSAVPVTADANSTAGRVARAYLAKHVNRLLGQDGRVRYGLDDSVHQFRVACRRLRSSMSTYEVLYPTGRVKRIRAQLKELGAILGVARDAEVLRDRLLTRVREEDPALVEEVVAERIRSSLQAEYDEALVASVAEMSKPQYMELLEELAGLVATDPKGSDAKQAAIEALPKLLVVEWKRLRRRVRLAGETPAGHAHDLALHEVRKGAKRLRYAAESAKPALGAPAANLAEAAEALQEVLGDRHDGAVARQKVLRLRDEAREAGEDTFAYGRMHALEDAAATQNLAGYRDAIWALNKLRRKGMQRLPIPEVAPKPDTED